MAIERRQVRVLLAVFILAAIAGVAGWFQVRGSQRIPGFLEPLHPRAPLDWSCRLRSQLRLHASSGNWVRAGELTGCEEHGEFDSAEAVLLVGDQPFELWPGPAPLHRFPLRVWQARSRDDRHWLITVAYGAGDEWSQLLLRSDDGGETFARVWLPDRRKAAPHSLPGQVTAGGADLEELCVGTEREPGFVDRVRRSWAFSRERHVSWLPQLVAVVRHGGFDEPLHSSMRSDDGGHSWRPRSAECSGPLVAGDTAHAPPPFDLAVHSAVPEPAFEGPEVERPLFDSKLAQWPLTQDGEEWIVDISGHGHSFPAPKRPRNVALWPTFDGTAGVAIADAPAFAMDRAFTVAVGFASGHGDDGRAISGHIISRGDPEGGFAWDLTAIAPDRVRFTVRDDRGQTSTVEGKVELPGDFYAEFDPATGRQWLLQLGECRPLAFTHTRVRPAARVFDGKLHLLQGYRGHLGGIDVSSGVMLPNGPHCSLAGWYQE